MTIEAESTNPIVNVGMRETITDATNTNATTTKISSTTTTEEVERDNNKDVLDIAKTKVTLFMLNYYQCCQMMMCAVNDDDDFTVNGVVGASMDKLCTPIYIG
jgi:hypothetical protein